MRIKIPATTLLANVGPLIEETFENDQGATITFTYDGTDYWYEIIQSGSGVGQAGVSNKQT